MTNLRRNSYVAAAFCMLSTYAIAADEPLTILYSVTESKLKTDKELQDFALSHLEELRIQRKAKSIEDVDPDGLIFTSLTRRSVSYQCQFSFAGNLLFYKQVESSATTNEEMPKQQAVVFDGHRTLTLIGTTLHIYPSSDFSRIGHYPVLSQEMNGIVLFRPNNERRADSNSTNGTAFVRTYQKNKIAEYYPAVAAYSEGGSKGNLENITLGDLKLPFAQYKFSEYKTFFGRPFAGRAVFVRNEMIEENGKRRVRPESEVVFELQDVSKNSVNFSQDLILPMMRKGNPIVLDDGKGDRRILLFDPKDPEVQKLFPAAASNWLTLATIAAGACSLMGGLILASKRRRI